ncbi:uncharacterized protein N7482_003586 [Penicillium canariense]|uniref:BTB domain-containing protein n=1 Tax=Penicillium canariense TaxID=189055 RepID=A0A9W9I8U8_9EURO|nr:uncharacterized protein N7482_003586 [Penicillium canariense]KAJ5167992.1 hypothetical protein N7482_003586 [Penicillium canariense]
MNPPTHIIDPDGEVIIILRNANSPFAQSAENMIPGKTHHSPQEPCQYAQIPAGETTAEEPPLEMLLKDPPVEAAAEEQMCESLDNGDFRIQVSAKHMIFASPVFKKTLTGGWKESIAYLQEGSVEVTADSWDLQALLTLLRAIHGQYYLIPRKISLEMLAKVAAIADYYACKEVLSIIADMGIDALEEKVPTTYSRDLILSLPSSKSEHQLLFHGVTVVSMVGEFRSPIKSSCLVSNRIAVSMNNDRQDGINNVILLHDTREALLNGTQGCGYECRSIMYGALTMQMQSNHLLSPWPATPFPDLSYGDLINKVSSFTSPRWYTSSRRDYHFYGHTCDDSTFTSMLRLNNFVEGLDLNELHAS